MTVRFLTIALLACFTVGCVNNYDGTRIEADIRIRETSTFKRADVVLPTRDASPGDPTYFSHYELHANILGAGTIRLKTFIIQPAVQVDHPCLQYQDDWFCRETETSPCPDYINMERFANLEDILVAVTVAPTVPAGAGGYLHAPAYDLMNPLQFPDFLFLDPDETDPATKLHRDNLDEDEVREFCDDLDPDCFPGNVGQLTKPLSGQLYGPIFGPDPRTGSVIGGITFSLDVNLEYMTELILTRERDPSRISEDNIGRYDMGLSDDGQIFLIAQKHGSYGFIRIGDFRGVMTVRMESPIGVPVTWDSTIYYDMDEDPITF